MQAKLDRHEAAIVTSKKRELLNKQSSERIRERLQDKALIDAKRREEKNENN